MNIKNFSFLFFSFQFSLNNTDGLATSNITPIIITSIDRIINTFINSQLLKTKTRAKKLKNKVVKFSQTIIASLFFFNFFFSFLF